MDVCASMDARSLHNIFPEKFELQLYQAFRALKQLGCDYFYFLGMDSGITYRFCTHDDWIDFYKDEKFILNDPLKRVIENTPFIILPWEQISLLHGNEKKTMYGRISFGLFNGLTISRDYKNRKYVFALATELKEHDLARYLILEKADTLEKFIHACMRLFDQYQLLMITPTIQIMM
ncbi:autoinducer binding domain-containing protein [Legionella quateirensis]|uniref:Transcription factor LuxR-like autoinducer-binding domain-containing protein n=1 Tax=Legionella quateirensis TaxID=45072 RepID=A0A378KXY6_9GAMM|nr:autoinducer binding domain-containing protein [Legionella quateirensis]KTD47817.1 hypothetical protein Lqua_2210 [Legionella quateirensis]STY16710.1 Uncharacterised protein [Legionella quateirensis]